MTAYAETYVPCAQETLGCMLQAGTAEFGLGLYDFYQLFLTSSYANAFSQGDISLIAGRSGCELALSVVSETLDALPTALANTRTPTNTHLPTSARFLTNATVLENISTRIIVASPTYWTGWALAYYQWTCGLTFSQIDESIPVEDVRNLYDPYHEMDIRAFCQEMDRLRVATQPDTPLKSARLRAGLSQSQLAKLSGVPVRSIQQYEQRQKSINRASAQSVCSLARALCCTPQELLEHSAQGAYEYTLITI